MRLPFVRRGRKMGRGWDNHPEYGCPEPTWRELFIVALVIVALAGLVVLTINRKCALRLLGLSAIHQSSTIAAYWSYIPRAPRPFPTSARSRDKGPLRQANLGALFLGP